MTKADRTLRTLDQLVAAGLVDDSAAGPLAAVVDRFAIALTSPMRGLITPGDMSDPIARQFLPDVREARIHPAELPDPIGDHPHTPVDGIVHRYTDRVLLKIVGICPVYCRFCFRREMIGPDHGDGVLHDTGIERALEYLDGHSEINEVILTGGDPFILSPRRIARLTDALGTISHVAKIRWHTRVPVVEPSRLTDDFIDALRTDCAEVRVAIHANHPRELTPQATAACRKLGDAGIALLSQTVLLRGINDQAETLTTLMRAFVEVGIRPYYLHHGDLAPGTAHFRTTIDQGKAIMRTLTAALKPEQCPTYVLDLPGGHGKIEINDANFVRRAGGDYVVRAPDGTEHTYRDIVEDR